MSYGMKIKLHYFSLSPRRWYKCHLSHQAHYVMCWTVALCCNTKRLHMGSHPGLICSACNQLAHSTSCCVWRGQVGRIQLLPDDIVAFYIQWFTSQVIWRCRPKTEDYLCHPENKQRLIRMLPEKLESMGCMCNMPREVLSYCRDNSCLPQPRHKTPSSLVMIQISRCFPVMMQRAQLTVCYSSQNPGNYPQWCIQREWMRDFTHNIEFCLLPECPRSQFGSKSFHILSKIFVCGPVFHQVWPNFSNPSHTADFSFKSRVHSIDKLVQVGGSVTVEKH